MTQHARIVGGEATIYLGGKPIGRSVDLHPAINLDVAGARRATADGAALPPGEMTVTVGCRPRWTREGRAYLRAAGWARRLWIDRKIAGNRARARRRTGGAALETRERQRIQTGPRLLIVAPMPPEDLERFKAAWADMVAKPSAPLLPVPSTKECGDV